LQTDEGAAQDAVRLSCDQFSGFEWARKSRSGKLRLEKARNAAGLKADRIPGKF
jgi:hypothetical protein